MKMLISKNWLIILITILFIAIGYSIIKKPNTLTSNSPTKEITEPDQETNEPISILVFGDMMLDRFTRQKMNENGLRYPFELIKEFVRGNDIVVANSEGSFTSFDSVTVGKKDAPLNFTFNPDVLPILKNLGFTLLGQANNHTLNFGFESFSQSKTLMTMAGLDYFGDPQNIDNLIYAKNLGSEKIGFIAYNEFSYQGLDNVLSLIKKAKETLSYIIVYPHWGEEYNLSFTSLQQKTAHSFIDAGADVVIGMHPHVIEPIEIYNNKPIFYSLGNFIFDQSEIGPTGKGLAIKIMLEKKLVSYYINPFNIRQTQAALMTNEPKQEELNDLSKNIIASDNFKKEVLEGIIKIIR
jgi:poly-gamma-glutamate synthesis protein (capsule biosynthesis protein)